MHAAMKQTDWAEHHNFWYIFLCLSMEGKRGRDEAKMLKYVGLLQKEVQAGLGRLGVLLLDLVDIFLYLLPKKNE